MIARVLVLSVVAAAAGIFPVAAAARPYVPSGQSISGGTDQGAPAPLTPGVYVDTLTRGSADLGTDGSVRYYAISVRSGESPYVAATLAAPTDAGEKDTLGVEVALVERDETLSCKDASSSDYDGSDGLDAVTAVAAPGPVGRDPGCAAGSLLVRVTRSGTAAADKPLKVEIAYRLEPVASSSGPSTPETTASNEPAGLAGKAARIESGSNYTDSPVLGSGIYTDSITADDLRVVRVHLDWGQRFAFSFNAGPRTGGTDDDVVVRAAVRNPLRESVDTASGGTPTDYDLGSGQAALSGSTLVPVRYANRNSDDANITEYANAGDYYLVLTTSKPDAGGSSGTVPYTLQIRVFGAAGAGPSYRPSPGATAVADSGGGSGRGTAITIVVIVAGVLVAGLFAVLFGRRGQARTHT